MTKLDIVNQINKGTGIEKDTIMTVINAFTESVIESLSKDEPIYIRKFGSFIVKERAEKTARNIAQKTTIIVPAHKIPAFKPSKEFVGKVQGK